MGQHLSRRRMLQTSAAVAAGAGYWLGTAANGRAAQSPNEKLNVACIGIGGQGGANLKGVRGENVVALCDVDDQRAGKAYDEFPAARKFADFRRLLDELDKQIDAVVVSTPDHAHFHPAMMAMRMGKHCYCEKPLAHSVWECRELTRTAAEMKVATQLGAQRHTYDNIHRVVELIQAGAIGTVSEVHSWVDGDRGLPEVPAEFPPVPSHLQWDLWLGPAKARPYHPTYCPYGWRFWWDFGTGETGNWGCHILDIPFWALGLQHPQRVEATGPPVHAETTPKAMQVRFAFPALGNRPALSLHWHHAKSGPELLRQHNLPAKGNNNLFIGSGGMLLCGFSQRKLYPEDRFGGFQPPAKSIPDSPGFHKEWIAACKGGPPATCHFDYSGPMAETVLLGNVAYRAGGGFDWDAAHLRVSGNAAAAALIRASFRAGWEI